MAKLYSKALLVLIFAVVALGDRPTFILKATEWGSPSEFRPSGTLATGGDLLVHLDAPPASSPQMAIRRRNSDGDYILVANFTESYNVNARTNGKWVALMDRPVKLFSVDETNTLSEMSSIDTEDGFLLSDDTFVAYDPTPSEGFFYIRTFQYESVDNRWNSIPAAEIPTLMPPSGYGAWRSYQVTETHLSMTDYFNSSDYRIKIYERLSDKSWSMIEDFSTGISIDTPGAPFFNGIDTVAYSVMVETLPETEPESFGLVLLFTKTNGEWSIQNELTVASVGYTPPGELGFTCLFLDADTLLITAVSESFQDEESADTGRVLMLARNSSGVWEPIADIDGPPTFGTGMNVNDHDLLISSLFRPASTLRFHSAPKCFHRPINVTCNNQQVTDCNDLSDTQLYTINNPECGAVDVDFVSFNLTNNQSVEFGFSFTRVAAQFGTSTVYCNTTITCPTGGSPGSAPIASSPSTAPGKVNTASGIHVGFASILTVAVVALFF